MNLRDQLDAGQKLLPQRGLGKRKKMGCIVNTYDFQQNFQGEFFNNGISRTIKTKSIIRPSSDIPIHKENHTDERMHIESEVKDVIKCKFHENCLQFVF